MARGRGSSVSTKSGAARAGQMAARESTPEEAAMGIVLRMLARWVGEWVGEVGECLLRAYCCSSIPMMTSRECFGPLLSKTYLFPVGGVRMC